MWYSRAKALVDGVLTGRLRSPPNDVHRDQMLDFHAQRCNLIIGLVELPFDALQLFQDISGIGHVSSEVVRDPIELVHDLVVPVALDSSLADEFGEGCTIYDDGVS